MVWYKVISAKTDRNIRVIESVISCILFCWTKTPVSRQLPIAGHGPKTLRSFLTEGRLRFPGRVFPEPAVRVAVEHKISLEVYGDREVLDDNRDGIAELQKRLPIAGEIGFGA